MRGLRSFAFLLVASAVICGYALYEYKNVPADTGDKKEKAFTVEADKIEEVTIKSESGERTTLRKAGTAWQIVQPATGKPDSGEVSGITSNLASLEVQRVIDENPPDLAEYALTQPRVELTFKAAGKDHKLAIGRKTPPGSDLYARLDDQKRVVLIPSSVDATFNRTTFDLRDKAVLTVNREEIGALTVATPSGTTRFDKVDGEWKIAQPLAARGDFSAVEALVSRLTTLQMKSIAAPQASDLAQYGLDKPAATVTMGSGSSQAALAIGKSSGEGAVFARDLSKPLVVTIDASLLDDVKKPAADYRQKDLFDARGFNATRIELARNGVTTTLEKVKGKNKDGQDQEVWKQTTPTARDADPAKVENLISAITQGRAASFLDGPPAGALDKPELTVAITSNEGKRQERVTFGRAGADVIATRAGEPGAAKIDTALFDAMTKALEEMK